MESLGKTHGSSSFQEPLPRFELGFDLIPTHHRGTGLPRVADAKLAMVEKQFETTNSTRLFLLVRLAISVPGKGPRPYHVPCRRTPPEFGGGGGGG